MFKPNISNSEKMKLDGLYVDAIVETSLCHSWGRNRSAKEFVSALRPGYKLPETRKIKEIQIDKRANLLVQLKEYFWRSCASGTLSADGWSAFSKSYFALLLHYIDFNTLEPV